MKINIIGPAFQPTGFGHHTKEFTKALADQDGVDVSLECQVPKNKGSSVDNVLYNALKNNYSDETNIAISHPHHWRLMYNDRFNCDLFIGFLVFEGDKIPSGWTEYCNADFVDAIFVPSTHVEKAAKKAGVTKPIFVVPEGVDLEKFSSNNNAKLGKLESDKFTFLFNKGWSQRKRDRSGLYQLVLAWKKAFGKEDKVRLIVKVNPNYGLTQEDVNLLRINKADAELQFIANYFDDKTLIALYNTCDVFVNPAKAEGFGLPILEAMACGKPVMAVGYGGHTDFLSEEEGWLLDYDLEPSTDGSILYEETKWAKLDVDSMAKMLKEIANNKDLVVKKGKKAAKKAKRYSWEKAAKIGVKHIKKLKKKD